MEPSFELATPADLETLLAFIREFYDYDGHPFDEATLRPALAALLANPSLGRVWLIRHGATPIGYVVLTLGYSLEYRGRDAFVDELYLREPYRGHGVGRKTFVFLEDACRALGVQALHLEVERSNTAAQQFYRKIGLTDQDRYLMTRWVE
jgi:GNAT superfamily N-acetyltransferase